MVSQGVRAALVVAQVALSLMLLVGAGLMMRSFVKLSGIALGFEPSGLYVSTLRLPEARYANAERLLALQTQILDRLRGVPSVSAAAMVSAAPFAGANTGMVFTIPEQPVSPGATLPDADVRWVTPGYFGAMKVALVRGRDFAGADRENAPPTVVVNEAAAQRYWPGQDPVGRQIEVGPPTDRTRLTVIGVVRDARYYALEAPDVRPMVYVSALAQPPRVASLVVRATNASLAASAIEEVIHSLDAQMPPPTVQSVEELVADATATSRFGLLLFAVFAATALIIAALGIYGVLAYLVRQRSHELGVRIALGAPTGALLGAVVGGALRLAAVGIVIGVAGAWATTRLLATLLFNVTPLDLPTFAVTIALLLIVAALASLAPAVRATHVDPLIALRSDV